MSHPNAPSLATAIIAEDEPLLADALNQALQTCWPELEVLATCANGLQAMKAIENHQPNVVFLDIRMPGMSGIEVAQALAEDWPDNHLGNPPVVVFVTAHDEYAVDAFDSGGLDYILKPVSPQRLTKTVARIRRALTQQGQPGIDELTKRLQHLLAHAPIAAHSARAPGYLSVIRAGVGDEVRVIPTDRIVLLESADKYVLVHTAEQEALIREPLRSLREQLDPDQFVQVHRGAIVNMKHVEAAVKDENGKLRLRLNGLEKRPVVSRIYRPLFQAM